MKVLKFIVLIFFLGAEFISQAQVNPVDGSKYLTFGGRRAWSVTASSKVLKIQSQKGNTVEFTVGGSKLLGIGNKIYGIEKQDTFILYNYDLKIGDTFTCIYPSIWDTVIFKIDTIKNETLMDGKEYKHWYLKGIASGWPLIWIENLGEKSSGWFYRPEGMLDNTLWLEGICIKDELVYWLNTKSPSCNFDSIQQAVGIKNINKEPLSISPIPANDYLTINNLHFQQAQYSIYSNLGRLVQKGSVSKKVPINKLPRGIYYLTLSQGTNIYPRIKFIKK